MTPLHKLPSRASLPTQGTQKTDRPATKSGTPPAAATVRPPSTDRSEYTDRPGLNGNEVSQRSIIVQMGERLRDLAERTRVAKRADSSFPEVSGSRDAAQSQSATTVRGSATPELPIADHQAATSTLTLDGNVKLEELKLKLDVAHTFPRDLVVTLTSPDGTEHTVVNRDGTHRGGITESFDLSEAFKGTEARGEWTLTVRDEATRDTGTLRGWTLEGSGKAPEVDAPKPFPTLEGPPVVVVVDGGIDTAHLDLKDSLWVNAKEIPNDGIDNDGNGYVDDVHGINVHKSNGDLHKADGVDHGTHVAGIVAAADNNKGNTGVAAGKALVMGVGGIYDADDSLVAFEKAVEYVVDQKVNHGVNVRVLNASFGEDVHDATKLRRWDEAVAKLREVDVLVVAATDNGNGSNMDFVPGDRPANANLDNVLVVASMDAKLEKLARFSSYGPESVDLAAPGQDILSTTVNNRWKKDSGTSYATPHVAATAALMFEAHPGLTAIEARRIILETVQKVDTLEGKVVTGGMLDIERAVEAARALGERARAEAGGDEARPAVAWG
ncbi:MAG TPA: S8 family serine peptidase [Myxococcaceae bacterium]|nr:S8 family serine peptidase [Myxococcaceae bacterium]